MPINFANRTKQRKSRSKKDKVVAIAEDVLKQIRTKKYIVEHGEFVELYLDGIPSNGDVTHSNHCVRTVIKNYKNNSLCHVCALGSLLMSKAKLFNKVNFSDIRSMSNGIANLETYFTHEELKIIEVIFEEGGGYYYECSVQRLIAGLDLVLTLDETLELTDSIQEIWDIEGPTDKLIILMENLIKNDGCLVL